MWDLFEEVFEGVMDDLGITAWYDLFDSDRFDEVERRIAEKFGKEILETDDYTNWVDEMCDEL